MIKQEKEKLVILLLLDIIFSEIALDVRHQQAELFDHDFLYHHFRVCHLRVIPYKFIVAPIIISNTQKSHPT